MHTDRAHLVARLQLLAVAALFSTGGAAVKATSLTGWQVASFRSAVAALVIVLVIPAARQGWAPRTWLVGAGYALTMVSFVVANKLTTAANAIFLQSAAPLYILLLGPLVLKERIRRRDVAFIVVVAIGLACFFLGEQATAATAPNPRLGNIVALLSGVGWAATVMGLRWVGARDASGATYPIVVAGNVIAFLVALPLALPLTGSSRPVDWLAIGYLGVFQIGLAYILMASAIRHVAAFEASALLLLEPALSPVWAWLVHDERPGPLALAGGALILVATLAKTFVEARRGGRSSVPPSPDPRAQSTVGQ